MLLSLLFHNILVLKYVLTFIFQISADKLEVNYFNTYNKINCVFKNKVK